ncbi:MAG: ankyrin repeat domain-containing protein [Fusobacteriaceae bacterium]
MGRFYTLLVLLLTIFFTGCMNAPKREIPEKLVYEAILADDTQSLTSFFNSGFSPDYKDSNGISLLDMALKYDSSKSIQLLVQKEIRLDDGFFKVRSFRALQILVESGANLDIKNRSGEPLIIFYIKNRPDSFVKYLISKGVSLESEDNYGWKPIFWASSVGSLDVLKEILKKGADPKTRDRDGNFPIYYVTDREKLEVLLEYNYDLNSKNNERETIFGEILMKAVANREFLIIDKLIQKGVDPKYKSYGRAAIDIANGAKDSEMIEFLNKKIPR